MRFLSILFPPKFHKIESYAESCVAGVVKDPFFLPDDSKVLWRAYDVRQDGIERMAAEFQ